MRILVSNTVFARNELKPVRWLASVIKRPANTFRPERPRHPHHVKHIPARPAIFPAPFVWIVKITPQQMANELVVKPNVIEPDNDCVRRKNFIV